MILMIVTVTMNPAIDKTVEMDTLICGGLNRIRSVEYDAGGKGINVSKTLHELGGDSIAIGFLGGNNGRTIERVLKEKGIPADFVWVDGETRTNTKICEKNGNLTELNEPGPVICEENLRELLEKIDTYAQEDTLFVLSGSVPSGIEKDIYADIITHVHGKGAKVLLDADGELFAQALPACPDMIKPNRAELEAYAGSDALVAEADIIKYAKGFVEQGIENVVISMGKEGALFFLGGYSVKCPVLPVEAHSTVGAGDAMVAALACAWEQGLSKEETVRLCMAASAGAVMTEGTKPPKENLVNTLKTKVVFEQTETFPV
jgi:1-phosphofructokinase